MRNNSIIQEVRDMCGSNPSNTAVFAQGNTTSGIIENSGNMMSNMNATSTDECEEHAKADKWNTGNI